MKKHFFIWATLLFFITPIMARAQSLVSLRLVAISDSAAPGVPGSIFSTFTPPVITRQGHAIVGAKFFSVSSCDGLWIERNDTTLDLLALGGTQAVDAPPGVSYSGFFYFNPPVSDTSGKVLFQSGLAGSDCVFFGGPSGMWFVDSYGPLLLGYTNQPAPSEYGVGRTFGAFNGELRMNSNGVTLFQGSLYPYPEVLWRTTPGGPLEVLDSTGMQLPGFPPFWNSGGRLPLGQGVVLNDAGTYATITRILNGAYYQGDGIFSDRSGSLSAVYTYQTEVPGGVPADSFTTFDMLMMNRDGHIAFFGTAVQLGSNNGKLGLWAEEGGSLQLVVIMRTQAPGTPTGVLFNSLTEGGNAPNDVYYTNDEQLIFMARLTGTGVTLDNDAGVWRRKNGVLELIAREGDQVAGVDSGILFDRIDRLICNEQGDIVLLANIKGPGVPANKNHGLWALNPNGDFVPVVIEGDRIEISPGEFRTFFQITLATGRYGLPSTGTDGRPVVLNSKRQIAFKASFLDNGIMDEGAVVADLDRVLTKRLPVQVLQKLDGQPETPVANATVQVGHFTPSDPFNPFSFTQQLTDSNGVILLDTARFAAGDDFFILHKTFQRPTPKTGHEAVDGNVYEIVLDNLTIDSTGTLYSDTLEIKYDDTTRTYLHHATLKQNFIVSIEWPAQQSYVDSLIKAFENASNYLYDISNGQTYLGNIDIYDNGQHWNDADIRIHASHKQWPSANVFGIRTPGEYMFLPPKWFGGESESRNGVFIEDPLNPNDNMNYRTIVHELGHLAFGFYDEYIDANDVKLQDGLNYGFMDYHYLIPFDPLCSEMSADSLIAGYTSTAQWQKNKKTCWDFFRTTFDTTVNNLKIRFQTPSTIGYPPGINYILGPNDSPKSPEVNVAKVTFVYGTSTGSSAPNFRTRFTDPNGNSLVDFPVSLIKQNPRRIIELGGTTNTGRIHPLGADVGDSLIASREINGRRFAVSKVRVSAATRGVSTAEGGDIIVMPIAGAYQMLSQMSFETGGLPQYSATTNMNYPTPPNISILRFEDSPVAATLSGDSSGYSTIISDALPTDNSIMFTAPDSVGTEFTFPQILSIHTVDSALVEIVDGRNGLRLALDTSVTSIDKIAILSSVFPPPRTGLPDSLIQLTSVIAINVKPSSSPLHGRLTLRYSEEFDSITTLSLENAAVYHWSNGWTPLATNLDTLNNTASALIQEAGYYAVYLIPTITGVDDGKEDRGSLLPKGFRLDQNYPNPFNPLTVIRYQLPVNSYVTLKIFDVLGREIVTLIDGIQEAGFKSVEWDAAAVPSGVYFYCMQTEGLVQTKKLILVR